MIEKLKQTKLFTVFLSVFYVLGLYCAFCNHQLICAFIVLVLLIAVICFLKLTKMDCFKIIILYLILIFAFLRVETLKPLERVLSELNESNITVKGKVVTSLDNQKEKGKVRFYVLVKSAKTDGETIDNLNSKAFVNLSYEDNFKPVLIGQNVEIKGKIRTPKPRTNPHQFDYKRYLFNNDCLEILYGDINDLKIIEDESGLTLKNKWYNVLQKFEITRNKILEKHSKNIKSPALEILGGIVFGNETINPDAKIKDNFKNSGLLHLLAASGLNVALIFGIWWWLANLVRFPYNLSILIGIVFVILYIFMTGFPPSILRAGIMLLFVLFGKLADRNAYSIALIFFAAFLILLFNPKMLFDVGFQLSFVVTFGLIVTCPCVIEKFKQKDNYYINKYKNDNEFKKQFMYLFKPTNLVSAVLIPFIAQMWVIPLQMHYFNNIAPMSVLANIAVIPFVGLLSFIGFISSIFALIPKISSFMVFVFDSVANPFLALLIKISEIFASFKFSLIDTVSLNPFQMFCFWLILLILVLNIKYDFKNKKQILVLVSLVVIFSMSFIKINSSSLEIAMFDVDNADCFLIKTPKNKYIMVDTGKHSYQSLSSFETIIKKYLLNKRVKKLDTLLVTHFDNDHAGGVIELLNFIKCKEVIIQKDSISSKKDTKTANDIIDFLKENNLNYKTAKNNETVYFESDLEFKTYTPVVKKDLADLDNETSIVSSLTYKDKNILFMADVGTIGFNSIEKYLPSKVDILKIGHHGAVNVVNQNMLKRLKPKYAMISAGSNRFNHPDFSTLDLLNKNNVETFSTKTHGFVKISIDKDEIKVFKFKN